jgi:hypothetical protein
MCFLYLQLVFERKLRHLYLSYHLMCKYYLGFEYHRNVQSHNHKPDEAPEVLDTKQSLSFRFSRSKETKKYLLQSIFSLILLVPIRALIEITSTISPNDTSNSDPTSRSVIDSEYTMAHALL